MRPGTVRVLFRKRGKTRTSRSHRPELEGGGKEGEGWEEKKERRHIRLRFPRFLTVYPRSRGGRERKEKGRKFSGREGECNAFSVLNIFFVVDRERKKGCGKEGTGVSGPANLFRHPKKRNWGGESGGGKNKGGK